MKKKKTKKLRFPHRSTEAWNGLEGEVVCARMCATNIHDFKEKLDKNSNGNRTV